MRGHEGPQHIGSRTARRDGHNAVAQREPSLPKFPIPGVEVVLRPFDGDPERALSARDHALDALRRQAVCRRDLGGIEYPDAPTRTGPHVVPVSTPRKDTDENICGFYDAGGNPTHRGVGGGILLMDDFEDLPSAALIEIPCALEDCFCGSLSRHGVVFRRILTES